MSSENFCLKWNDHHSVFFTNVESLCEKSFLTDVVLSAGGSLFQAHKLVLSICSTYFQDLFSKSLPGPPANTVIYLKDVEASHLQLLLAYMYRGEVNVEDSQLAEFLKTASGLQVRGLTESQTRSKKIVKEEEEDEPTTTWANASQTTNLAAPLMVTDTFSVQPVTNSGQLENQYDDIADYSSEAFYKEERGESQEAGTGQWRITEDGLTDKLNKAFPCEMCNMSFNQKWLLRRHWKTHTGVKPYKCSLCSRTFSLRDSCTRHIRTVHKDQVDTNKDNVNNQVEVTDPDFEPNNVMAIQYAE